MEHREKELSGVLRAGAGEIMPVVCELVRAGREVRLTITGNSMYPLLRDGRDSVVLARPGKLRRGCVPLYRRADGSYVLHRIVRKKDGAFVLLGDNQTEPEFPVYPEQVVALAKGFYRNGRYISCKNPMYRFYAGLWSRIIRLRPHVLAFTLKARSGIGKIRKGEKREKN